MNQIKLSEIFNLSIRAGARKMNSEIFEFIACVLSEYALNSLNYDESDNTVYPAIHKYFVGGEISAKSLIEKLRIIPEVMPLYEEFPELFRDGTYDYAQWDCFLNDSEWSIDAGKNCFVFNQNTYVMQKKLLSLKETMSGICAQRYIYSEEHGAVYGNIGNGQDTSPVEGTPLFSRTKQEAEEKGVLETEIEITEEEFFELSDTIKAADKEQREAIKGEIDKNLVILAGAGSGKTRTLVCRLAYLHLVKKVPLNKILLLTFTTSAASEMKRRSIDFIEPIYDKFKPFEKPNVNARTIDSFVINFLDTHYAQMGFAQKPIKCLDGNEDTERERLQMLEEVICENKMQGVFSHYFDGSTGKAKENFRWLLNDLEDYACGVPINCAGFDTLLQLYLNKQRLRNKVMGFTEASLFVREAIHQPNSALKEIILSRYSCVLIDEFQDVNVLQNSIFEPFYNSEIHFTFVGDDDQSIYYWRGSDSSIIRGFLSKPNVRACYLLTNYRNNPNIVEAGNAVLRTIKDRAKKDKPIRPNKQTGAKIHISTYDDKYTNLVNEVSRLLNSGQSSEEICILSRDRESGRQISRALTASDIPVAREKIKVDVNDNYKLMKAILNIMNDNNVTASVKEIRRIMRVPNVTERHIQKVVLGKCDESDCEDNLRHVKALGDELRQNLIENLADTVYRYSIKAAELFENITNDRHSDSVFELFEDFCRNNNAPWPVPQTQLKELFNTFEDDTRKENRKGGALSNGVKVSTIHAAKGLEYNVVIITGLSDGKYPSTDYIDTVYRARSAQLATLAASRENYYRLKQSPFSEMFVHMLNECSNPAFSRKEKERMAEFKEEILQMRNSITALSADGVEEYIDAYRYYVLPLEMQYRNDINEQMNFLLVEKTVEENLRDEVFLLEQEDARAARLRQKELDRIRTNIAGIERKIDKSKERELRFAKSIATLKQHYGTCLNASGLLADMEKADEIEALRLQLTKEKEQRIDEERRLYYVAVTRARDLLYLCHERGTSPSEFIEIIGDELKAEHVMLTLEEEREIRRLTQSLHEETARKTIDEEKVKEQTESILSQEKFKSYIRKRTAEFDVLHSVFTGLTGEARAYYEKAIGLQFVAELTGGEFKTEFAHNMQRMAEVVLQEYSGQPALPFKTSDLSMANQISHDIRRIARKCVACRPSPRYLTKLLTENGPFSDELTMLKSAGVMHYVIRSGRYPVAPEIKNSWKNAEKLMEIDDFLVAALDLSSTRNTLIHDNRDKWPEDPIPMIFRHAELIIRSCKVSPKPEPTKQTEPTLNENQVQIGLKVHHMKFGSGIVTKVTETTFSVDFETETSRAFLITSAPKYFKPL